MKTSKQSNSAFDSAHHTHYVECIAQSLLVENTRRISSKIKNNLKIFTKALLYLQLQIALGTQSRHLSY